MNDIAVLFDLDGVLVDTETLYSEFWSSIDREYPTGVENFSDKIKGSTLKRIFDNYFPNDELQAEILAKLIHYEENMQYRLFDGVIDFLRELKINNIKCAIVTSSGAKKMNNLFSQQPKFKKYFDTIIVDTDVSHGKPNPECYLLGAARLGVKATSCYVFEDSLAGIEAGQKAGAKVIAVATTLPKSQLQAKTDIIIDGLNKFSVTEMLKIYD
jgi:HAD superfamily hydrolase (TIGR01509 family)